MSKSSILYHKLDLTTKCCQKHLYLAQFDMKIADNFITLIMTTFIFGCTIPLKALFYCMGEL